MEGLIAKELHLCLIPPSLIAPFEKDVLEMYFISGWIDLHTICYFTEEYSIRAISYEETGSEFSFENDPSRVEENAYVAEIHFNELMSDVNTVLKYHQLFFAWKDLGDTNYDLVGCYNIPVKEVW
jgi:hypothetical protein